MTLDASTEADTLRDGLTEAVLAELRRRDHVIKPESVGAHGGCLQRRPVPGREVADRLGLPATYR